MILKNGLLYQNGQFVKRDIRIENNKIREIAENIEGNETIIDCQGHTYFPGAIDVHVHLREPGFEYKETILTGTKAASKGGITTIMSMPNLNPVPDCVESLLVQTNKIAEDALVYVYPYASFTKGQKGKELADIEAMAPYVKAISDDGVGVNDLTLLYQGMTLAKKHNLVIASHAEDALYKDSPRGEYEAVRREIEYAKTIGCKYHFCHMSTKESFVAIRKAQQEGYPITCEVSPHHLFLNEDIVQENPNFKMNPPLRSEEDRLETVKALLDGTASIVATDHAPHALTEKIGPYETCLNGITGLETMIPLLYTNLIKPGIASFEDLINWIVNHPAKVFDLPVSKIEVGEEANFTVLDIETPHVFQEEEILSLAKNTPFIGMELYGWPVLTLCRGKIVYQVEGLK